jgi:hypothetical protein
LVFELGFHAFEAGSLPCLQPFFSGYSRVLLFAQVGLDCNPSILHFPPSLGWQAHVTSPIFFPLRWGVTNCSVWNDLNCNSPDLSLPSRITGISYWLLDLLLLLIPWSSLMSRVIAIFMLTWTKMYVSRNLLNSLSIQRPLSPSLWYWRPCG